MWVARTLRLSAYLLLGLVVLAGLMVAASQTAIFRNWARGLAEQQAARLVNGEVTIGSLDGNLFTGADLTDVTIRQDGRAIIRIERATAQYDLRRLLSNDLALTNVTITRPVIVLVHNGDGWRIGNLLKRRTTGPSTRTLAIESLTVEDGTVLVDDSAPEGDRTILPRRFEGLGATLALTAGGGRVGLDFTQATFHTDAPALDVRSLTGRLVNGGGVLQLDQMRIRTAHSAIDLDGRYQGGETPHLTETTVRAAPLDVDEFAAYLPRLAGRALSPTFNVSLDGPFEALEVKGVATEPTTGSIRSEVTVNARAPIRSVRGSVTVERLNLATVFNNRTLASDLTASTSVDLTISTPVSFDTVAGHVVLHSKNSQFAGYRYDAIDGTVRVMGRQFTVAADASGYGAVGRVDGTIGDRDNRVAYDLRGRLRNVDLRRLPDWLRIPALESDIAGVYTVAGVGSGVNGTLAFDASTVEGVAIEAGSQGRINLAGEVPQYGFDGHVADLDARRVGRALGVERLDDDRFASRLAGRLVLDGSGRDLATLRLDVSAELEPSSMFDAAIPTASIHAHIENRQLTGSALGEFASLNLAALTGRDQLEGEIAGTFDVRTTIADFEQPLTLDSVSADGSVHLGASTIGPLTIDTGAVEGRYANRGGNITSLSILGPELEVTASGPIALGDSGDSQLTYRIFHGRLDQLAPLVGRDVAGRLHLNGTLTGNGSRLASTGTATLAPLRVDTTFDALEVNSTFEASLEDLRTDSLRVSADIDSTLLTVAGRNLNGLTGKVSYADSELEFQSTVMDERRTVTATGRLVTLSDAREVKVEQFAVEAAGVTWSSIPGQAFTAHYGADGVLTLDEVVLTSGNQRLITQGSISLRPNVDGMLDVRAEQVDVEGLGTLLLVSRTLGGVLNGSGRVTGDSEHRLITGKLAVSNGLVDGFQFESLDASLRVIDGRVGIEALLRQAPGSELTVNGALVTSAEGASANAPLDLDVKSAGIDLAILDAASTVIDQATGRLAVDLHVGGTAATPRVDGSVNLRDGAFVVASTGTRYSGATLDVLFEGDRLHIGTLQLLDDQGQRLEGSGSLRLAGRRVEEVDLTVKANEFRVLANELGDLSVDTTLNIYGTLLSPRIAGLVRVHSGRLEVDALVDRFTSNAYAVPLGEPGPEMGNAAAEPTGPMGPTFDVAVQVPNNLVLRGRDIRPSDATVALGDLNVTVGGDFIIRGQPGSEPVLLGTVTAVRGTYTFQDRRFDLLRDGTIAFRSERPIDPSLDLQAERVISGIVAHVDINGTMRSPLVRLSSRPPLDEGDILALILFNQPVNRLGAAEREALGERAVSLASGFVVSPISGTIERALDIDLFELEAITDGGGPAVTFGEQIGERLFVRFRQTFGTQEASEFQLEYQLADFLRLQGSLSEGRGRANRSLTRRVERGGIDLVVFFSY